MMQPTYMTQLRLWWEAADAALAATGRSPLTYEQARLLFEAEVEPGDVLAVRARVPFAQLKQGHRPHFIEQWADHRGLAQKDIARALGVDKGVVSRWFSGSTPSVKYQEALASLFETEREGLFRHPDEDWLAKFLAGRRGEMARIKATLEAAFP